MREVVTLQFGPRANYLGTHFWNIQGSYQAKTQSQPIDHDILYRLDVAPDGTDTYLPRTLIYDLAGNFGSLAQVNVLGAEFSPDEASVWSGKTSELSTAKQRVLTPYQQALIGTGALESALPTIETTRFFSDFATTYYSQRSLVPVTPPHPTLTVANAGNTASSTSGSESTTLNPNFSTFAEGNDRFEEINRAEYVLDSDLRYWLEECDSLQAIQLFTSSDDAWAGFASGYVDELRDALSKTTIWVWGLDGTFDQSGEQTRAKLRSQTASLALLAYNLGNQGAMYTPLSIPKGLSSGFSINTQSPWHTTALAAATIDTATLPIRMNNGTFDEWSAITNDNGHRQVLSCYLDVKENRPQNGALLSNRGEVKRPPPGQVDDKRFQSFFANLPFGAYPPRKTGLDRAYAQIRTSRGEGYSRVEDSQEDHRNERGEDRPFLQKYLAQNTPFPIVDTFPNIFANGPAPGRNGSMAMRTELKSEKGIALWLRGLDSALGNFATLVREEFSGTEIELVKNELRRMSDLYVEDWEDDEDSDEN